MDSGLHADQGLDIKECHLSFAFKTGVMNRFNFPCLYLTGNDEKDLARAERKDLKSLMIDTNSYRPTLCD